MMPPFKVEEDIIPILDKTGDELEKAFYYKWISK
jgi:hypothetical protein